MADLSKIASSQPIEITDGTNSAVLANSLPSGSSYGLVVREASQGQQTMANSSPVVIASDQSTLVTSTVPATSGGLSTGSSPYISAASTNATSVKGSAGQLYGMYVSNINVNPRYVKLYNKASSPTVGSDTPIMTFMVPGNSSGVSGAFEFSNGIPFSTGIAFAITGSYANADTTAISAGDVIVNILYK